MRIDRVIVVSSKAGRERTRKNAEEKLVVLNNRENSRKHDKQEKAKRERLKENINARETGAKKRLKGK